MALSDPYVIAAEYRAAIKPDADGASDAAILIDLKAISRHLERKLGRFFNKDVADVTRVYIPQIDSPRLWIDDLSVAPTSIKVDRDCDGSFADETALVATDYDLYPLNAGFQPEPEPYTAIILTTWGTLNTFSTTSRVQVIGKFGWPAVPEAIRGATVQLTALYRLETPRATRRIPEMGDAIESSPDAQRIIRDLYMRYRKASWFD